MLTKVYRSIIALLKRDEKFMRDNITVFEIGNTVSYKVVESINDSLRYNILDQINLIVATRDDIHV